MEQILTIIAAVIGLAIGAFIVRQAQRTWLGRRLFAADEARRSHEINREDPWAMPDNYYEQEAIKEDTCYGNMGLGLGPRKPGES